MRNGKIWPATLNFLIDRHQNVGNSTIMQNYTQIGSGVSSSQVSDFAHCKLTRLFVYSFFHSYSCETSSQTAILYSCWVLSVAGSKDAATDFDANTSKDSFAQ